MSDSLLGALTDETFGPRRGGEDALVASRGLPQAAPSQNPEDVFLGKLIKRLDDFYRRTTIVAALPAHNAPHFYSWPIDLSGRASVPAAVGDWQTLASYTLENGRCAVINGYGMEVRDSAYTYDGSVLFRVIVNGQTVPTLQDFATRRGTLSEPRNTFIKMIQPGDTVKLQVKRAVVAAGAQNVDGVLVGWNWRPTSASDGAAASLAY